MDNERNFLEIFRQTEKFIERRRDRGIYSESADYAIRFCEAVVARFAKYTNRNDWTDEIYNVGADSVYLDILGDLEGFRKSDPARHMTYIRAVNECQYRIAMHLHMFDWREQLRLEHLKSGEHMLHLPWKTGSINDNIITACKEMGMPHRYNRYFQLEICVNGVWGKADSKCENSAIDVYFFPENNKENDDVAA